MVYDFVADRLRAVRKDLVVQGLHGPCVLPLLEPMVLFHVYAGYRYFMLNFNVAKEVENICRNNKNFIGF
jgi:hypothetical protein